MDFRISTQIGTFGDRWFNKDQVAAKVVASYGRLPTVKGLDLGKILQSYVRSRVTAHLQMHDRAGWRVYECYRAGSDWRWQRARAMDAPTLLNVIDLRRKQLESDRRVLQRLEKLYEAMIAYERATKKPAIVADVIANVP